MKILQLTLIALAISCCSFALTPITGTLTLCEYDTTVLSNATPGGSWSSSNPAVGSIDPMGIVSGLTTGTTVITYSVGSSYVTATVTVNFLPTIMAGITSICSSLSTTWTDAAPGGVWSSDNNAVATVGSSTGIINAIAGGVDTIWYTMSPTCYEGAILTVRQMPSISGTLIVTPGGTRTLTGTPAGGTWGTWGTASTGITIGTSSGIVTGVTIGTDSIAYISSGCPAFALVTVAATTTVSRVAGAQSNASVYPNPTTGQIEIAWDLANACTTNVELADVTGHIVYRAPVQMNAGPGNSSIDLAPIPDGIYILRLSSDEINYKGTLQVRR